MIATIADQEVSMGVTGQLNLVIMSSGGTTDVKTGAYNAVAGDLVLTDSSGGAFTVTMPPSPSHGDTVTLLDAAVPDSWGTANVTVARNGELIEGEAEDLVLVGGRMCILRFIVSIGWKIAQPLVTSEVVSPSWGAITGTLTDQTDLDTVLDGKQPLDADLTNLAALTAPAAKLNGIEASADVTDAANVAAAGAVMTSGSQLVSAKANNDLTVNPKFWRGTQSEYNALTPTAGEIYLILE